MSLRLARGLRVVTFFIALISSVPITASAQDARRLFQAGSEAYAVGNYDAAITAWNQAYALDPRPGLQFNLSQAYERLGRLPEAQQALETYLASAGPEEPNRMQAQARLTAIRARIERTGIVIQTDVEGVVVVIDGEDRARTPRADAIRVAPGSHDVLLRRSGYEDYTIRVSVSPGAEVPVTPTFTLESVDARSGESGRTRARSSGQVGPWIVVGGGGAALVTGAVLGGLALGRVNDASTREEADASNARPMAIASDVLVGVGAATAVGGLVWWLVSRRGGSAEAPTVSFDPAIGPTHVGAGATVRF